MARSVGRARGFGSRPSRAKNQLIVKERTTRTTTMAGVCWCRVDDLLCSRTPIVVCRVSAAPPKDDRRLRSISRVGESEDRQSSTRAPAAAARKHCGWPRDGPRTRRVGGRDRYGRDRDGPGLFVDRVADPPFSNFETQVEARGPLFHHPYHPHQDRSIHHDAAAPHAPPRRLDRRPLACHGGCRGRHGHAQRDGILLRRYVAVVVGVDGI